jgi:hypothetical protein
MLEVTNPRPTTTYHLSYIFRGLHREESRHRSISTINPLDGSN